MYLHCCTGLPGAETVSPGWTDSGGGGETDFPGSQKERLEQSGVGQLHRSI